MKHTTLRRVLATVLTLAMVLALVPNVLAADYSGWTSLTADFGQTGHEIRHLAMGCLYGIGEEDVPTTNVLTPIGPYTFEQKAPDGLQHPTGDAVLTAKTFLESGGQWIQIGCPDIKSGWYYEESPFQSTANYELYKSQLADMARKCVEAGLSGHCVYNIFNETDGNGGSWNTATATWCAAWKDFVETIRAIDPQARFSGPGYANYNGTFIRDWLNYCVKNGCEPFQITIHNLFDDRYNSMEREINEIRGYADAAGLQDYEVCVNEYGQYENLGNPAGLVKYIATLEDNQASGCLAFWNVGNDLDDLAADANEPNGNWWMYQMYNDMTGTTVKCTSSTTNINLYGLATIDEARQTAYALCGGSHKGNEVLKLTNLNKTRAFQNAAYALVTLRSTTYSGTYGPSEEPYLVFRRVLPIENGTVNVPMEGADDTTVYFATAIPVQSATDPAEVEGAWRTTLEGENAARAGGAASVSSNTRYPASNGSLASLPNTGSTLTFRLTVPTDGYYEINTVYGMNTGSNPSNMNSHNPRLATLDLTIDAQAPITQTLDNTMLQLTCDNFSIYPYLTAGEHTIKLQPNASTTGYPVIDCLHVRYFGASAYRFDKTYEAEEAKRNLLAGRKSTTVQMSRDGAGFSGIGYVTGLATKVYDGGGLRFVVFADENAMYDLSLRYRTSADAKLGIYLHNTALTLTGKVTDVAAPKTSGWGEAKTTLYLEKGLNLIDVDATSDALALDSLRLTRGDAYQALTTTIEAEACALSGNAATANNSYASAGRYVRGLEGKADGSNAITLTYTAEKAGKYQLDIYHSNSELFGNHGTNVAMIDRYITMSVNGGRARNVFFRNTYSADSFHVKTVTVELKAGTNTIKIWNDDQREYRRNVGGTILLDNFAPNLDKFALTPVTASLQRETHEHDTVLVDSKAPTCTSGGFSGNAVCKLCGDTVTYGTDLPATGHTLVDHPAQAPGCLVEGWKAYQSCANCSYTTYEAIAPTGHVYDEGRVTTEPTLTAPGVRTYTCIQCGATKTKRIPPSGSKVPESIDFTDAASADRFEIEAQDSAALRAGQGLYLVSTTDAFEPCNGQVSTFAPKDVVKIPAEGDWLVTAKVRFDQGSSPGYYEFFGFYAMDDYDNCVGIRAGDGAIQDFIRKDGSVVADTDGVKTSSGLKSASTHWFRIAKDGDSYTCYWSTDGQSFTETFAYANTGITGDTLCIDAYSGMSTGYNYLIESLTFEELDGPGGDDPVVTPDQYINYALSSNGGSATASSGAQGGNVSNVIDGNRTKESRIRWASEDLPATLTITLSEVRNVYIVDVISQVPDSVSSGETEMGMETNLGLKAIDVSYSEDGTNWKPFATGDANNTLAWQRFEKTALVKARYIKIDIEDPDTFDGWARILEVQVLGAPLSDSAACDHAWDGGKVTTEATCTAAGVKTYTCTKCGETKTEAIAALGHSWDEGVTTREPTTTEEGIKTFTCTRCKQTRTEKIDKLPADHKHEYTATVTAPTCTTDGYTTHTCSCGDSYKDTVVPPLGHDWGEGVKSEDGKTITYTCSRCGETKTENVPPVHDCPSKNFTDVPGEGDWAHAGIDYCVENGLMNGTSATLFSPKGSVTRAQLVTILYRVAGEPTVTEPSKFTDVPADQWYTDPIAWAAANGIVTGMNETTFAPMNKITREQIATILYRYTEDAKVEGSIDSFPDASKVSGWAKDALTWAVANELITGVKAADGTVTLNPTANATRAQIASIIMRYLEAK